MAKEVIGPDKKAMASYDTPLKILLNIYIYDHKLLLLSTLARKLSFPLWTADTEETYQKLKY